ncbi:MAG: hypothetical protein HKN22_08655 [Bacteroidia bacterium]|nr:hypothetical protein [Bacteroidia bacterium]
MKNLLIALLLFLPFLSLAQETETKEKTRQAYTVHEDRVKPSMVETYESLNQELVDACKSHNHMDVSWLTATMSDYRYLYVTPFDKFAEFDNQPWASLREKMGAEKFDNIFERMDKCYDQHGSYVIYLHNDYSYMPEGITQMPEGEPYRKYYYWHFTPDNLDAFMKVAKDFKELYAKKNSKARFRFYTSGYGVMGNFAMIAISAPDEVSFINRAIENRKLLGEEGKMLMLRARSLSYKYEEIDGGVRLDMSYFPEKTASTKK